VTSVSRCPHCGTPVEGDVDTWCCHGCELAARIIHEAGLDRYYDVREAFAPRPELPSEGWDAIPVETAPDGTASCGLQVDGLRCASCVWVTEHLLRATPGVLDATVSYATGRATLRWDPSRVRIGELAGRVAALGYRPRLLGEEASVDHDLLLRLGVAAFAAANIMLMYAALYAGWWGTMEERFVVLFSWGSLILATPVALWCSQPFFVGAWAGLRHRLLHMDLPIALAIAVLYAHGVYATVRRDEAYLDSLAMLAALLLTGRLLESRGRRRAAEAAVSLAATVPATAKRATGGGVVVVAAGALVPGDRIDVGAGEELAADGVVQEGAGHVRMALVTGEAEPVAVRPGSNVVAGSVLLDGAITVEVEAVGRDTVLQQMADQLRIAADRGTRPGATDRIAPWFTGATLVIASATFLLWFTARGLDPAIARTVAVLVVACPCALALSRPLAAAAGLGASARRGLLFRSADALLDLVHVDLAALDKTGTVTQGAVMVVTADDAALRIAAGLERYSAHPIARAIVDEAGRRGIPLPRATDVREEPGVGIEGIVDGRRWQLCAGGPGEVRLLGDGAPEAAIRLGDVVRPDSERIVRQLRDRGIEVALLTGDHQDVAERIGAAAGIPTILARVDPVAKADWVRAHQSEGRRVLFAGDGLNDGPALAAADVGIAMGQGAASSILVADGVISSGSLAPLPVGIVTAHACRRAIRVNQIRSIGYNILAVSAAVAGFVNPLVAAVLMPLSSALVIWGASRVEATVRRELA
jgi:Cu2+-exporting ATPase